MGGSRCAQQAHCRGGATHQNPGELHLRQSRRFGEPTEDECEHFGKPDQTRGETTLTSTAITAPFIISIVAPTAASFAASAEFRDRYGSLDDTAFVRLVYANVLGREPDGGGLAYWSGLLAAGVDRGTVMVGFSESAEFVRATGTIP